VQQQLTKLEKMCAQMQDENEKLIREASQYKKEQIRQVLELGEEADKLSSMRDYHAAELCYLHALKILPEHAQSLCNYAHLLHTDKKELDKAEVMYTKALQAEPHRAATLFNYDAYLLQRGQVREARDMYARACELGPTGPWIQENGHFFPGCSAANPTGTDNA
jgi:Tfp pilus assembly protein PilF